MKKKKDKHRVNYAREWVEGNLSEKAPHVERWSREGNKGPRAGSRTEYQYPGVQRGIVRAKRRRTYEVVTDTGSIELCQLPKNLDLSAFTQLVIGDHVEFSREVGCAGLISKIEARRNRVSRSGPKSGGGREQIMAANMDLIVLVTSLNEPAFNIRIVDRLIASTASSQVPYVLCFNKTDTVSESPPEVLYLKNIGEPTVLCSAKTGEGIDALRSVIKKKKSLLTGPSGVGKSSILNALFPLESIFTRPVREGDGKGRHTTTTSQFYFLDSGTWIADTPGIREISTEGKSPEDLILAFKDIQKLAIHCRYRNCHHLEEAECAVKEGIKQQKMPEFRYNSYKSLLLKGENRKGYGIE